MSEQAVIVIVEDDGNIADRWDQIVANLTANPIRYAAGRIRITVTTSPLGIAMSHAVGETATLEIALPPFATLMANISFLFQDSRQRGNLIN